VTFWGVTGSQGVFSSEIKKSSGERKGQGTSVTTVEKKGTISL